LARVSHREKDAHSKPDLHRLTALQPAASAMRAAAAWTCQLEKADANTPPRHLLTILSMLRSNRRCSLAPCTHPKKPLHAKARVIRTITVFAARSSLFWSVKCEIQVANDTASSAPCHLSATFRPILVSLRYVVAEAAQVSSALAKAALLIRCTTLHATRSSLLCSRAWSCHVVNAFA
jgi:hypothetical protein